MKYRDFEVFGGAKEFVNYRGPEAIIHGPAETGKTLAALYKLHIAASTYENASVVIVRKTLASTYSTVLQMFQNKVLYEGCGAVPYGGQKPEWFDYPATGARIWLTGMDKSSKVLSAEHDLIFWNQVEEATLDDWETLTTRTTGRAGNMPYSQTIGDCNPAWPLHWIYHRKSLKVFYSRHSENPTLFDQETGEMTAQGHLTMGILQALTGLRRIRLLDGKAAQAEGMIYTDWNEPVHLVDEAPQCRRHVAGVDWGYTHPGVIGVWGLNGDGAMYLRAQVYHAHRKSDWWAKRAVELNEEFEVEAWACDPSQPAYIAQFCDVGLNAFGAYNPVTPGIDAVAKRLAQNRLFVVRDNSRHLDQQLVADHLPHKMRDELPGYVWANVKKKEVPIKEFDDGCDMMRYAVAYVDDVGKERKPPPAGAQVEGLRLHRQRERPSRWKRSSSRVRR